MILSDFLNPCWQRGPPFLSISASSFFESAAPRYSASDQPEEACLQFNRVVNAQGWRRRGPGALLCIRGRAFEAASISAGLGERVRTASCSRGCLAFCALSALPTSIPTMKALSPVRGCYEAVCCLSERSLAIARGRGKGPAAEEPLSLLDDMNHCYSRLRELVPGVPRGTQLSQVEILQRVIDYILDLQVVLAEPAPGPPDSPHLPIQTAELAPELVISNDKRSFCH
ncbi:DNA-binding protein inhibitor ID-3 [Equus asinus]|uniref:DNA-binding protein inhibitor ID-3 n=1 Tax=Equus asinus TaxID=9793 RepID=A0A9L0K6J7_EQUAS